MAVRVNPIPSGFTGAQADYLVQLANAINALPAFSFFSGLTPESVVTGVACDIAFAPFSQSTGSLFFVKWGSPTAASKVSWCKVSVSTVA